jgi:hypothetical protein
MKLICKAQDHLVLAYRGQDTGEFVFVLCRQGLEKALKMKIVTGQKFEVEVDIKFNDYM